MVSASSSDSEGKQLSKYEQQSNWTLRPLRKAQVHYAALDALVCIKIYKELETKRGWQEEEEQAEHLKELPKEE